MALALMRYVGRRALARLSRRFHHRDHEGEEDGADVCSICLEPPNNPACLPCLHVFCHDCLNDYIQQREMSVDEFIVLRALRICMFPCPVCRTLIYKEPGVMLNFPPPDACDDCHKLIKKAYIFPNCGHVNENQCISCIESYEYKGNIFRRMIRCPTCLLVSERGSLKDAYKCSICARFTSESICKPCVKGLASPYRNPQERRQHMKSECYSTTLALSVIAVLLYLAIMNTGDPSWPLEPQRERIPLDCSSITLWHVDPHERVFCEKQLRRLAEETSSGQKTGMKTNNNPKSDDKVIESPNEQSKNEDSRTSEDEDSESEKVKKENGEAAKQKVKKKLVPIYQTDCYPASVWEVSPDGEVQTKKCEKVLLRYREE